MAISDIPYCGAPPAPGGLNWNLDPVLMLALLGLAGLHLRMVRRDRRVIAGAGWAIVGLALITPLCNLSMALFSARVTQHVIIALIGAPLIAFASGPPGGLRRRLQEKVRPFEILAAPAVFAVFLWLWHMPGAYDATLKSDFIYWTMHITMFGAALWLWRVLLDGQSLGPGAAFATSLVTGFQMSILGSVLALNTHALFAIHFATTQPWGLSPLQDQQVGGMIMWVPAGILVMGYAILAFAAAMRRMDAEDGTPF